MDAVAIGSILTVVGALMILAFLGYKGYRLVFRDKPRRRD